MMVSRRGLKALAIAALLAPAISSSAPAQEARIPEARPVLPTEGLEAAEAAQPLELRPEEAVSADGRLPRARPPAPGEVAEIAPAAEPVEGQGDADEPLDSVASRLAAEMSTAREALEFFAREPRPRPDPPATLALVAPTEVVVPDPAPGMTPPNDTAAGYSACLSRLRGLGVGFYGGIAHRPTRRLRRRASPQREDDRLRHLGHARGDHELRDHRGARNLGA